MMRHIKTVSYIMVLSLVLSCANHSVAQNAPSNHNDQSEQVTDLKENFKKMSHRVRGYIRCFTSEAGCSQARKAAVTAAIIGLLFLVGRQERRAREEHIGRGVEFERESRRQIERARRDTAQYLEKSHPPGWRKQEVP